MDSRWKRKALSRGGHLYIVWCAFQVRTKSPSRLCWWPPSFLPRLEQVSAIGWVWSTCFVSFRLPPLLLRLEFGTSPERIIIIIIIISLLNYDNYCIWWIFTAVQKMTQKWIVPFLATIYRNTVPSPDLVRNQRTSRKITTNEQQNGNSRTEQNTIPRPRPSIIPAASLALQVLKSMRYEGHAKLTLERPKIQDQRQLG